MVLMILMVSLLLILSSLGFIVCQIYKVRSHVGGFKPMAKLLLGDDLQYHKFDENTARQILSLLHSPIETDTKYYPATTYNQHTARTGDEGPPPHW